MVEPLGEIPMQSTLLVFLGAGIGGVARYGVNLGCTKLCGPSFPVGIMAINLIGSLLMGIIAGYLLLRAEQPWAAPARLFLTTGILGGFTTFSAFSLDAVQLIERGEFGLAALYVIGSVMLAILACFAGLFLIRSFA